MERRGGSTGGLLYAPAICPRCGNVFPSDVPMASTPWIAPIYRATGGACPRCGTRSAIAEWTYRFHATAIQGMLDASTHQRRDLTSALEVHLRRHRTAKQTAVFARDLRGPWKIVVPQLTAASPRQRRAQLLFLLWILTGTEQ